PATQSTQATRPARSATGLAHVSPLGVATFGHVAANPMSLGVKSPAPSHVPSAPPHARQMWRTLRASALSSSGCVEPSPGGHDVINAPAIRLSQQRATIFERTARYFVVSLPIVRWQRFVPEPTGTRDRSP